MKKDNNNGNDNVIDFNERKKRKKLEEFVREAGIDGCVDFIERLGEALMAIDAKTLVAINHGGGVYIIDGQVDKTAMAGLAFFIYDKYRESFDMAMCKIMETQAGAQDQILH